MPGPPPKDPSQRRRANATIAMTSLPRSGRKGPVPKWPLPEPSKRELELWRKIWKTPQAVQWDALGWHDAVARYVRMLTSAELPDAHAKTLAEVRQMEDRLGLSPLALLRLRWKVEDDGSAVSESVTDLDAYRAAVG